MVKIFCALRLFAIAFVQSSSTEVLLSESDAGDEMDSVGYT
jgi:hypothetical protein